jgi:transcriptional regulator with XRE-family HTH domain
MNCGTIARCAPESGWHGHPSGKAVYDQRRAPGLSVTDLAGRADMTVDEIACIEEGGTEPTIAPL